MWRGPEPFLLSAASSLRPVKSRFPSQGWAPRPAPGSPRLGFWTPRPGWEGMAGPELGPFAAVQGCWGARGTVWGSPSAAGRGPLRAVAPTESWKPGSFPVVTSNVTVSEVPPSSACPPGGAGRGLRSQNKASGRATKPPPEGSQDAPHPQRGAQGLTLLPFLTEEPRSGGRPPPRGFIRPLLALREAVSVKPGAGEGGTRDILGLAAPPCAPSVPGRGQVRAPQPPSGTWSCPRHLLDLRCPEHIRSSSWPLGTALGPGEPAPGAALRGCGAAHALQPRQARGPGPGPAVGRAWPTSCQPGPCRHQRSRLQAWNFLPCGAWGEAARPRLGQTAHCQLAGRPGGLVVPAAQTGGGPGGL